ncbi:MAG TPA: PPOX class F420-dependent oxidoreductase [Actinomycetota bacterium]|nr:PPOX class F420-dependent oxidoreductase [Actinomycetota bacterium]
MDVDEAKEFIRSNHRAILITHRKDGRLQTSPVAVGIDAEGMAVISSRETAYKTKNLRRDPHATATVFTTDWYGPWVQIEGEATIVSLPEAMDGLVDYYRGIAGEHPDWDDYRAAMEKEKRLLIKIDIAQAGPSSSG